MDDQTQPDKPAPDAEEAKARAKPLVHYRELIACKLGGYALLLPADHPSEFVSNTKPIMTSQVVKELGEDGSFETMNTRYEPAPKIKM